VIPIAMYVELPPALAASSALRPPAIVSPAPREASFGQISGRVFAGTTRVRVLVDGVVARSRPVSGATAFAFSLNLPARDVRITVSAQDATGARSSRTVTPVYGLPRPARPFPTRPSSADAVLGRRLRSLARAFPGTAAVYAQDLRTGRGAAWNARARFPAASTLKLAIAMETLRTLGSRPAAGSSVDRLLWSMLVYSDNAAANSLLVRLGGSTSGGAARVNALMRSLGIRDSLMYGGYATATLVQTRRPIPLQVNEQPAIGIGKYTTAWDLVRLHRSVHQAARGLGPLAHAQGSFGRRDARYLLWLLAHVADHGKLDRNLPGGISTLHKAGWIRQARHDAGLVYWRGGVFVAAVMTWNSGGVGSSSDILAGRVARSAFERFRALRAASSSSGVSATA
jgi:beta-lactamase class A